MSSRRFLQVEVRRRFRMFLTILFGDPMVPLAILAIQYFVLPFLTVHFIRFLFVFHHSAHACRFEIVRPLPVLSDSLADRQYSSSKGS